MSHNNRIINNFLFVKKIFTFLRQFKKILKYVLFILITVLLTAEFYNNTFKIVDQDFFESFQKDSESIVVGRLLKSKNNGVFSEGGFLGWNHPHESLLDPNTKVVYNRFNNWGYKVPYSVNKYTYQYDALENNYSIGKYEKYYSRSGFQGVIYSGIERLFKINGDNLIKFCRFLNALFLAIILSFFLLWVFNNFGLFSASICFLFILFSHWIIVYANNMLYVSGLFFLPMVCNLYYLHFMEKKKVFNLKKVFLLTSFTILLKCVISGFDFIIPTLVMAVIPLFFYSYINKINFNVFFKGFTFISIGALSGVIISLILLVVQLANYHDSWREAINYLIHTTERRTYGNLDDLTNVIALNEKVSVLKLLDVYLNGIAIDLSNFFDFKISFKPLFSVIFLMSTLVPLTNLKFNKKIVGLIFMLWISLVGPLTWFIIFKYHTITHQHTNQIMWYLPSLLFGAILVAYLLQKGFQYILLSFLKYFDMK